MTMSPSFDNLDSPGLAARFLAARTPIMQRRNQEPA